MFRLLSNLLLPAIFLVLTATAQTTARLSVLPGPASPPADDGTVTAPLVIRSVNGAGTPIVTTHTNLALAAYRFSAPGIVISEITLDAQEIEFVNPGETAVDLSEWTLEAGPGLLDSPQNRQRQILGPAVLPPGGILVWSCRDGAADIFPRLASRKKFGAGGANLVEIRDAAGRIVDQVLLSFPDARREQIWRGNYVNRSGAAGQSLHRRGSGNRFSRLDWSVGPGSIGSPDPALTLPWLGPRINLPLQPATAVLTNGLWSGLVHFNPADSSRWQVSASPDPGIYWDSGPQLLPVMPPLPDLTLDLVDGTTHGSEATAGRIATIQVRLPAPLNPAADLAVTLGWDAPGEFTAPQSVVIPAGETVATFGVTNLDDSLVDGRALVHLTASAAGYGSATHQFVNDDNEFGQLRLSLPETAAEGAGPLARRGAVFLPSPAAHDTEIDLVAEGRLSVPVHVIIPSGASSVTFPVWVQDDDRVNLPPLRDTVSARTSQWPAAGLEVRIIDDEIQSLRLELPRLVYEGRPTVGRIVLGQPSDRDLLVDLKSTEPRIPIPGNLTVHAGQTEVTFPLSLPEDQWADSWMNTSICASYGNLVDCQQTFFVDNDFPPTTLAVAITPLLFSTEPIRLQLTLIDGAGAVFPQSGPVTLRIVPSPGNAQLAPDSLTVPLVDGRFDGNIRFTGTGHGTVLEAKFNGLAGISQPLEILPGRFVEPAIADIAAWPGKPGLLALRLQTNASGVAGQLMELNPADGGPIRTLPLPSPAQRLAISDNGAVAWLGSLSNTIQRVDLAAWKVTAELPLANTNGFRRALALAVSPGAAEDVAVLTTPISPAARDTNRIIAFHDGQRRENGPILDPGGYGADLVPGRVPGEFFAVSSKLFHRLELGSNGLTSRVQHYLQMEPVDNVLHPVVVSNQLFLGNGGILDADTLEERPGFITGSYPPDTAVCPFPDVDAVLFATRFDSISTFNLTQRTLSGRRTYPGGSDARQPIDRLVRYGATGAALLSWTDRNLILLDEALRRPESADLAITIDSPAFVPLSAGPFTVSIAVTNNGPDLATDVRVHSVLGDLVYDTLLPGEGRTTLLTAHPKVAGTFPMSATVRQSGVDPLPTNNTASASTLVTASVAPGQIVLPLPLRHVLASSDGTRLFAAVGPEASPAGIAEIDPLTGERVRTLPVGSDPQRLQLTPDGRKILALIGTNQLVRWNLDTGAIDFDWSVANDAVVDFANLPGTGNRLAILNRQRLTLLDGTNVVQSISQPLDDQRRMGVQGNRLWLARNGELRAYKINPGNLISESVSSIFVPSGNYRFSADDRRLFFAGKIRHTAAFTESATSGDIPLLPAPGQLAYGIVQGSLQRYDVSSPATSFLPPQIEEPILPLEQTGNVVDFVRWGSDGFAFRTDAGFLVIVRAHLVPAASADLSVSLEAVGPTTVQSPSRYRVLVTNRGPEAVSGFQLTVRGTGFEKLSIEPPVPSFAGRLYVAHGKLDAGASYSVEITGVPVNYSGTVDLSASVVGPALDPTPYDNTAQLQAPVTPALADFALNLQLPDDIRLGEDFIARVELTNRGPMTVIQPDLATHTFPTLSLRSMDRGIFETTFQGDVSIRGLQPALEPGSSLAVDLRFHPAGAGLFPLHIRPDFPLNDPHPEDNTAAPVIRVPLPDGSARYPRFTLPFMDAKWSKARNQWIVSDRLGLYFLAPTTLKVLGSVTLPGVIDEFYLTDDGQYVWLADGSNRATRYSLATGQPDLVASNKLDISAAKGLLMPIPGRPDAILVLGLGEAGELHGVVFENGKALPKEYSDDLKWQVFNLRVAAGPDGRIYVSTGINLRELTLEADGLHFTRNLDAYERGGREPMAVNGGLLMEDTVMALDLTTLEFINVGDLTRSNPDNIAYRQITSTFSNVIEAYDCARRQTLWQQPANTPFLRIFSGGSAGVLILGTDGGWLAAPPNPGVDLHLQAVLDQPVLGVGQVFKVKLQVGSTGAWQPGNLRVLADLSPGLRAIAPASDSSHWEVPVQPGALEFSFQATTVGDQELRFHVVAEGTDPAPADNEVVLRFTTPEPPVVLLEDLSVSYDFQPIRLRLSTAAPATMKFQMKAEPIDAEVGSQPEGSYDVTFATGSREASVNWYPFQYHVGPDEHFRISVGPGGPTALPASAVLTLVHDRRIQIQSKSVFQPEGNSDPTVAIVPIVLANSPSDPVAFRFSTVAGTALPGEDFVPTSGTLLFAPGVRTNFITIPIVADQRFEPAETFTVDLTDPSGLLLPDSLPTVTLQNDDLALPPFARAELDASGRLSIRFDSELGAQYSLHSRTNLTLGAWKVELARVIGIGGPMLINPAAGSANATYFRVVAR